MRECIALIVVFSLSGCAVQRNNQSFSVTVAIAKADVRRMKKEPMPLMRPLIIISGYSDPGIGPALLAGKFHQLTGDDRIATVVLPIWASMEACRRLLVTKVEKHFPSPEPNYTVEIDAIGISIGGVVARYAASGLPLIDQDTETMKQLQLKRLFTISSPHRGAKMASLPALTSQHLDVRSGSEFLHRLNSAGVDKSGPITYNVVAYTRLEDGVVGAANTAPPNQVPRWVPRPPLGLGHIGSLIDARIIADIARRLRNEEPWTKDPPESLPIDQ